MRHHRVLVAAALLLPLLAIAAVFAAGGLVPGVTPSATAADPVVLEVDHSGIAVKSYTLSDLQNLGFTYNGYAGIQNSAQVVTGPDPVTGIKIIDVLNDAFGGTGLTSAQSLDVYSPDPAPYIDTLTYDQVVNPTPVNWVMFNPTTHAEVSSVAGQLACVLVWARNSAPLGADEGQLRLYCADGTNENVVMRGSDSVYDVTKLNVRDQVLAPWQVKLVGLKRNGVRPTDVIDNQSYQTCAAEGCHGSSFKTADGQRWTGVPVYMLMGQVDGGKDMTYNAALARRGYRIRFYSTNGRHVTISSKVTVDRRSIIVANGVSGAALGTTYYPLRLVGPTKYVSSRKYLGRINRIVMLPPLTR